MEEVSDELFFAERYLRLSFSECPRQGLALLLSGCACRPMQTSLRMRGLYEQPSYSVHDNMLADTLVIYVYSKTDPEYERNLHFFVNHGMWEGDGCEYLIIVQQVWSCPGRAPNYQHP
jgi:hypothetical protein